MAITAADCLLLMHHLFSDKVPRAPHPPRNGPNSSDHAPGSVLAETAECVRAHKDTVAADAMVRINAFVQRKERCGDARERARCGYHERNDHLQPRRLLHVSATQDSTRHHARDRDNSNHAAFEEIMSRGKGTRARANGAYVPHCVDGRHHGKPNSFNRERTTGFEA